MRSAAAREVLPVRIAAVAFVALALVFGLGAFKLGFRADGVPGPGLLPLLASLALLPIGIRLLVAPRVVGEPSALGIAPLVLLLLFAVQALLMPRLGFVLPTVALLVVWARAFHRRSLVASVVLAVLLTAAAALLFNGLLAVRMPLWPGSP
jgi:hypothetical protein